ncbi:MAG: methyl-accepting chemotaxis protein [Gracilibacteraceae bacterium]|jgi:methyl-accepting chemotaxis protein|nr:methyl-accepting chemotaxis protein [Gracilibacteraceae bacterium]
MGIIKKLYKDTSLRLRFVVFFSAFAILPLILMGVIVYINSFKTNERDAESHLLLEANLVREGYDSSMSAYSNMITLLSSNALNAAYLTGDEDSGPLAQERMTDAKKILHGVAFIFITDLYGRVVLDSEAGSRVGSDFSEREYFIRARQTGQQTLSQARIDNDIPNVVYLQPIKIAAGSIVGYMGFVVDLAELSAFAIDTAKIMETGSVEAVEAEELKTIMTPRKERLLTGYLAEIPGFKEAVSNKNISSFHYKLDGTKRVAAFSRDENLGWVYIAEVSVSEVTKVSSSTLLTMLILSIIVLVVAPMLAVLISSSIVKPIKNVSGAMEKVAAGDLTIVLDMEGGDRDDVAVMGQRLDSTVAALNQSVGGVKEMTSEVQGYSDNLAMAMEQMSTVTGEVTSAIQDVAKGATNQASDLTEIVGMLSVFAAEMESISVNAGNVNESSVMAEGKAVEGRDQVTELSSSIMLIGKSFGAFMETISDLGISVSKIGDITDAINAISDQTNLLALNAAIEAARAGEQGKGFAVVADEVRNLAAESKKSSEEIMELIRRVSQETQGVIKASEEVNGLLSNQENVISKTVESFQLITDAINTIGPLVTKAEESVVRASQAREGVISRVEDVAAVSEEVSASAEEIAASSEELLSSIEDISGVSGKMNRSVNSLFERVKVYKTN